MTSRIFESRIMNFADFAVFYAFLFLEIDCGKGRGFEKGHLPEKKRIQGIV